MLHNATLRQKSAFRPGTLRNRRQHWSLYLLFCAHYGLRELPASPSTLILFVEFLARSFKHPKSITNTLAGVRSLHLHRRAPTAAFEDFHLTLMIRALPLTLRHLSNPASPCTLPLLHTLVTATERFGARGIVLRALFTVAFFGFLRLSSLLPERLPFDSSRYPLLSDLTTTPDGFLLRVKHAKNAQRPQDAFQVPLLTLGTGPCCPVRALLALRESSLPPSTLQPLFLWPPSPNSPIAQATPLTASTARRWLRILLVSANLPPHTLTFHSFRRGGCAAAAWEGASIPDLQALGHWRSDAVRLYAPALPAQLRTAHLLRQHFQTPAL